MSPSQSLPGGFCEDCFKGTLRGDLTPTGTEERLHGLPVYIARPKPEATPKGIIIIIPDAFGWELRNTRALADVYARRGPFLVYLPDFMNGWAPPASLLSLGDNAARPSTSWFTTLVMKPLWNIRFWAAVLPRVFMIREPITRPRIEAFFHAVRSSPPPVELSASASAVQIGAIGFCWGGRYTALVCSGASPLADCGFTAHPSLLAVPAEVEPISRPFSVANGEDDEYMGRQKMVEVERILEGKGNCEVIVYPGARHGFAVRGDPLDPKQAEIGLKAEDQAVAWFRRWFK